MADLFKQKILIDQYQLTEKIAKRLDLDLDFLSRALCECDSNNIAKIKKDTPTIVDMLSLFNDVSQNIAMMKKHLENIGITDTRIVPLLEAIVSLADTIRILSIDDLTKLFSNNDIDGLFSDYAKTEQLRNPMQ